MSPVKVRWQRRHPKNRRCRLHIFALILFETVLFLSVHPFQQRSCGEVTTNVRGPFVVEKSPLLSSAWPSGESLM